MSVGDPWEDEGYAAEDDWGEESLAADIEEEALLEGEPGEPGPETDAGEPPPVDPGAAV